MILNKTAKEKNIKTKTKKKKKKTSHIFRNTVIVLILIIAVFAGIFAYKVHLNGGGIQGVIKTSLGHDEDTVNSLDKIYCLILGESQNLTDTIMVASYDPKTQEAALLSIPRDTFIGTNPDYASAYDKINAVYQSSVDELLEDVNELTGLNIQYYLTVDTEALKVLVDEIGGVWFDVPIDMNYTDKKQGLYIDLEAGYQLLDGDKAEQLVRFRHNSDGTTYPTEYGGEDLGRMKTQRAFLEALLEQTIENMSISTVTSFLDIMEEYVETNLDFDAIKDYIPYVFDFDVDNLETDTLPGESVQAAYTGTWIYVVDEEEVREVIDVLFYGKEVTTDEDGNTITNTTSSDTTTDGTTTLEYDESALKVEVINGSGSTSKAETVIHELLAAGYNVTNAGNATTTNYSTIIERSEIDEEDEEKIETILGVDYVLSGESSDYDITIIIGTDYVI